MGLIFASRQFVNYTWANRLRLFRCCKNAYGTANGWIKFNSQNVQSKAKNQPIRNLQPKQVIIPLENIRPIKIKNI